MNGSLLDITSATEEVEKARPAKEPVQADFRLYLQSELAKRCSKNPAYSLRSFARTLELHPATLSHLLSGKRKITLPVMKKLCNLLSLTPEQWEIFSRNLESKRPRLARQKPTQGETLQLTTLSADAFYVISDWYHFAILELIKLADFKADTKWIARSLNISVPEANAAIERLERLQLIRKERDSSLSLLEPATSNLQAGDLTDSASRKLQRQILEMALRALDEIPLGERDQSSMTFAMDALRMPKAIRRLKEFRRKFCHEFEIQPGPRRSRHRSQERVYHLSLSFYPVSRSDHSTETPKPKKERGVSK